MRRLADEAPAIAADEHRAGCAPSCSTPAVPVARETAERCGFSLEDLAALARPDRFPLLVNRLAAALDLPPLRQQMLLAEPLLERAASVAGMLRSRARVLDALRPWRHVADHPERQ